MSTTMTVFTDPFCTWSWGSEPILRRIRETYRSQVEIEFVMGGLVEDFDTFHDGANGISEPADVAPHWREAAERHDMPVDAGIWREDPPRSSYPPSIAYKAAQLQDPALADAYLRRLREAFAAERRRIDDEEVLVELADEVGLDIDRFQTDLEGDRPREAFHEDLERSHRERGTVFPSYLASNGEDRRLLRGYQPFQAVAGALETLDPSLTRRDPRPLDDLVDGYGRVATREIEEIYEIDRDAALERLRELERAGHVTSTQLGSGILWEST